MPADSPGASRVPPAQRPEIDGLRAFAILPVVLFHAGLGCPGGFIGVDVFFVISGFLIGGILLRELDAGKMSIGRFWERRVRRVVPMLLVLFAVTLLLGGMVLPPFQRPNIGGQTLFALFGLANFKMLALTHGYWGVAPNTLLLLHTWSLAVEEQFYVFIPLILAAAFRWFPRRIHILLLALLAASLALSLYWGTNARPENFYLLPARAWELLLGCLGAWALKEGLVLPKSLAPLAAFLGLLGIVISAFVLQMTARWPDAMAWLPVASTLLVLIAPASARAPSLTVRFLSLPPIRFIGLISYSLYLWHWPMVVLLKEYGPDEITLVQRWLLVIAAVALSALSWRYVEQPFRKKTPAPLVPIRPLLIGAGAAWLCLVVLSHQLSKPPSDTATSRLASMPVLLQVPGPESISPYDDRDREAEGGIRLNCSSNATPQVVLLGSSLGSMLGPVVDSLSHQYNVSTACFCRGWMSPLFTGDPAGNEVRENLRNIRIRDAVVKNFLSRWRPKLVILCARWNFEQGDRRTYRPSSQLTFVHEFSNTVRWLGQNSSRVVVVGQVPQLPLLNGEDARLAIWRRYRRDGNVMPHLVEHPAVTSLRMAAMQIFAGCAPTNMSIVDPEPLFHTPDHGLRYYSDRGLFYFDDHHLNSIGSVELKPLLEPFFKEVARQTP